MLTAQQVAEYFLRKTESDELDDAISNLKLQKLLYYAQGYHLGLYKKPLFDDDIEAWAHGPVVPSVYRKYSHCKSGSIPAPHSARTLEIDDKTKLFLDEVYRVMGQYAPWKLRNMTHNEPPWKNTKRNEVITKEVMKKYFGALVKK